MNTNPTFHNTEHAKEFNLEHAKAGAPYSQQSGRPARITAWDRKCGNGFSLAGLCSQLDGHTENPETWMPNGIAASFPYQNLVMLPLGFVGDKPVHVGDVLLDPKAVYQGGSWDTDGTFCVGPTMNESHFAGCVWPSEVPEIPKVRMPNEQVRGMIAKAMSVEEIMNAGLAYALTNQLDVIVEYMHTCGITIHATEPDFYVSWQRGMPAISLNHPTDTRHQWFPVFRDANSTCSKSSHLSHVSTERLRSALDIMRSSGQGTFNFQSFFDAEVTQPQILDEIEDRDDIPF